MPVNVEPEFTSDGKLVDLLTGTSLVDQPEERVRQRYLRILHHQYGYPLGVMAREVPITAGHAQLTDASGHPVFADIVVYESGAACSNRDQGEIRFVVECKKPDEASGHNQLVSYVFLTSANGAVWHNGSETLWYRREQLPEQKLIPWPGLPRSDEAWDAIGRRTRDQLEPLVDVRKVLESCHNKLHRRGSESEDLTMDIVRILLAKAEDEESDHETLAFYCTPEEYLAESGHVAVAGRIQSLFEHVRDQHPTVFTPSETITAGAREIVEVVAELQQYALLGDDPDDTQWDFMGAAYEQYTATVLKREGGEFFTNRLVTRLLARMLDPSANHTVLDPAGGTGGFCTAAIRHMRESVRAQSLSKAAKLNKLNRIKDHIFYIDIKHRLVKIAKAAMILTGNGHRGFTQGDSLASITKLPSAFTEQCRPGRIDRVLTNPPFAGLANGRIVPNEEMLEEFQLARAWRWEAGEYQPGDAAVTGGVPPEVLFIERCLQWLKPGGMLGIVVPKGIIENPEVSLAVRHFLLRYAFLRAVVVCHKNTFQPYTGSRTALLVVQKKTAAQAAKQDSDYAIFMAISRKIGQSSEGEPIFVRDDTGATTSDPDHDLDEIFDAWQLHNEDALEPSEFVFSVNRAELNAQTLAFSPQYFRPSLNEAIQRVIDLDESDEWDVQPLGDIATAIYKGARFRREDLEVEGSEASETAVRYYTPAALLQDRTESVKYLDLSLANEQRRRNILSHALRRNELLVTRSGSVGRVIFTTREHEGHIGSDDLIHVEIGDEIVRRYVYLFLKSDLGQMQMKRNEYGTIQQHLEPAHLRELLVPMPKDRDLLSTLSDVVRKAIEAKEESLDLERDALSQIGASLTRHPNAS